MVPFSRIINLSVFPITLLLLHQVPAKDIKYSYEWLLHLKLDPILYNGAILLGLDSPVIKSHGGTDFIGFANSLSVCEKIVKNNLIDKIKRSIN